MERPCRTKYCILLFREEAHRVRRYSVGLLALVVLREAGEGPLDGQPKSIRRRFHRPVDLLEPLTLLRANLHDHGRGDRIDLLAGALAETGVP